MRDRAPGRTTCRGCPGGHTIATGIDAAPGGHRRGTQLGQWRDLQCALQSPPRAQQREPGFAGRRRCETAPGFLTLPSSPAPPRSQASAVAAGSGATPACRRLSGPGLQAARALTEASSARGSSRSRRTSARSASARAPPPPPTPPPPPPPAARSCSSRSCPLNWSSSASATPPATAHSRIAPGRRPPGRIPHEPRVPPRRCAANPRDLAAFVDCQLAPCTCCHW